MPGWIWVILVIFLFAMLIIGTIYVVRHAVAALRTVGMVGGRVSEVMSRLGEEQPQSGEEQPIFTQPLRTATDRYAEAHAKVIEHREQVQNRHAAIWKRWKSFNEPDRNK